MQINLVALQWKCLNSQNEIVNIVSVMKSRIWCLVMGLFFRLHTYIHTSECVV